MSTTRHTTASNAVGERMIVDLSLGGWRLYLHLISRLWQNQHYLINQAAFKLKEINLVLKLQDFIASFAPGLL